MNKRQKLVQEQFLNNEQHVIQRLKQVYDQALRDIELKIENLELKIGDLQLMYQWIEDDDPAKERVRSMIQSKIYQKEYQQALQDQIEGILKKLQTETYLTVSDYLDGCYNDAFIGSLFDLHGQDIPLMIPLDQTKVVRAVQLNSKISQGLYNRLGEDVDLLKKKITAQVSRSVANGTSYGETARQLAMQSRIGMNNAIRIARTEGHRIQTTAAMDVMEEAKAIGANVVKQWDAALDGRTRASHRAVDGEIREVEEKFSNGLNYPGDPAGGAKEVINCRCALLQRARWALDEQELERLKERANFWGMDKSETFDDFRKKYLEVTEEVQFKELSMDDFKKLAHRITKEERSVVYGRTHFSGYINSSNARKINQKLRNSEPLDDYYNKITNTLQAIIDKNVLGDNIMVYRYVADDALEFITGVKAPRATMKETAEQYFAKLNAVPDKVEKGHIYTEKGFLSTSGVLDANVMHRKNVFLRIQARKGTHCYVTTNKKESEIIFGQNTKLKIMDVSIENSGTANAKIVLDCIITE